MSKVDATISACILARNEEGRIEEALRSLQGWTDQIIVIDNESEDDTRAIARRYTRWIVTAPRASNFDALRNLAIELATGSWIFYLDADERVPPQLGGMLRELVRREGEAFEAVCIPFKHFFCGKWMEHSGWWPGYKGPQLLKKGRFRYNERLHGGASVDGRTIFLSAENPDLAIVHYSYDDLDHYLEKLNRYTHGEAENLLADGGSHSWQAQLAHFVKDWQLYYEQGRADLDGMHGFVLSFMSAFYRFACRAKLWDLRRRRGETDGPEPVPGNVREMLEFMAQVVQQGADAWIRSPSPPASKSSVDPRRVPLLWRGPVYDTSGFAEEGRHSVLALIKAGEPIAVAPDRWQDPDAGVGPGARALIEAHTVPGDSPAELCVSHTLLHFQQPNPNARFNIARVMFEADRLPDGIAERLNQMDRVWVPCDFNRETFANSGVAREKIAVVPEALDPLPYASPVIEPWPIPGEEEFRFLSCFNWNLRKGWDVLIEAFAAEFGGGASTAAPDDRLCTPSVGLVIKWSSCGYTVEEVCQQVDAHLWGTLGRSLSDFPNIHLWQETVPADEMPRVYRAADAFVLPTRGEGWCRPLMEAMAAGLPTIATAWSGLTQFHNAAVGYPLSYEVRPVSPAAAKEAPCYAGRSWAEPSGADLRRLMRLVLEAREAAREKGAAAQKAIAHHYSHAAVAAVMREELARCRSLLERSEGNEALLSRGCPGQGADGVRIVDGALGGRRDATEPPAARRSPTPVAVSRVPLLWRGPLFDASGYADEARQFVQGLMEAGEPLFLAPESWGPEVEQDPALRARLAERIVAEDTPAELCVRHTLLSLQGPSPRASFNIARTMFETDRLPAGAAAALNEMDRIWVPSEFNRETFVRGGVAPERIAVVPGAIDPAMFDAGTADPWPVPGGEAYRFLSVFDWTLHKGWDVLLAAFAAEFGGEPGVGLVLKVWSSQRYALAEMRAQADSHLRETLGRSLAEMPNIHFWQETLAVHDLPRVYRSVDAFVLPTRGEGWCRPLMEAMAAGLPTIATAWSGLTQFHNGTVGYPLPYLMRPVSTAGAKEVPAYAGHAWAEPDVQELRGLMRQLVAGPGDARVRGLAARAAIREQYSRKAITARLQEELAHCRRLAGGPHPLSPSPNIGGGGTKAGGPCLRPHAGKLGAGSAPAVRAPSGEMKGAAEEGPTRPSANPVAHDPVGDVDFRRALGRALRVRWEGDQTLLSSLARVNREFCLGLLAAGDVELTLAEARTSWHTLREGDDPRFGGLFARRGAELSGPADVTVRQYFLPDWRRPERGRFIMIQPWEYGHLPREWAAGAREQADEVWAHSRFVRDLYVRSGVPAEKVRIVPLGFDPAVFRPDGPAYSLPTSRSLRLLFVGGAIARKGADLLLAAYQRAFTARDDVCLIVKDMGTRTFYQGMTYAEAFRRAQADPSGPEVLYLEDDLPDLELAALYRACACVVLPYRAEGFALPPLEGMACGKPAIVTAGGPTDDYLDDSMALRVPRRRRMAGSRMLGTLECTGDPWQLEPDLDALIAALRWVRDHPEQTRERGERARAHVLAGWTWEHATRAARERLLFQAAPTDRETGVGRARPWVPLASAGKRVADGGVGAGKGQDQSRSKSKSKSKSKRRELSGVLGGVVEAAAGPLELSLCMIVRDEEPRLAQCLKSIAPYVDEMVVVDTDSKDRTREVARECGARVFEYPWTDSFAEARNQSLAQARGEWIFWMDADDVISPECGEGLRKLIRACPEKSAAYQMLVRIPPGPGEFGGSMVDHVKLFPNRPDVRFEHRIHEQILASLRQAGLQIRFSDLFVTHQHYDRSEEGQAKKRRRDFRLLEMDLRDQPDHPFILFNLGMTHLYATRDYEVAAHYLVRCLERSQPSDSIVRKAYAMLTIALQGQLEIDRAVAANEAGRQHYPDDAELLFQAAQLYQEAGRYDEAGAVLDRLVNGQDAPHYRSVDAGLRTYRGRLEMALLWRRQGELARAARLLDEIRTAYPEYLAAQLELVETRWLLGEHTAARRLLSEIPSVPAIQGHLERLCEMTRGSVEA